MKKSRTLEHYASQNQLFLHLRDLQEAIACTRPGVETYTMKLPHYGDALSGVLLVIFLADQTREHIKFSLKLSQVRTVLGFRGSFRHYLLESLLKDFCVGTLSLIFWSSTNFFPQSQKNKTPEIYFILLILNGI